MIVAITGKLIWHNKGRYLRVEVARRHQKHGGTRMVNLGRMSGKLVDDCAALLSSARTTDVDCDRDMRLDCDRNHWREEVDACAACCEL